MQFSNFTGVKVFHGRSRQMIILLPLKWYEKDRINCSTLTGQTIKRASRSCDRFPESHQETAYKYPPSALEESKRDG
jgi:hypothetical protein